MRTLQIKPGQRGVVLGKPSDVPPDAEELADAVLACVTTVGDRRLPARNPVALAWVAPTRGGKLGTDLNRGTFATALSQQRMRPVRQLARDNTCSALQSRPGD